jgi:hypothetical protein
MRSSTRPAAERNASVLRRTLALAMVAGAAAATASAQSLQGEGPFAVNFVGLAEPDTPPIPISEEAQFGITNSTMTAVNAAGEGLLHELAGRCLGWWRVDASAGTFEQQVHCTYVDGDGDQIFERADFEEQALAGPRVGTGRWMGGTGKYRELSGVFEIRVKNLRPIRDGLIQYVGTKQGHYRLPTPEKEADQ